MLLESIIENKEVERGKEGRRNKKAANRGGKEAEDEDFEKRAYSMSSEKGGKTRTCPFC